MLNEGDEVIIQDSESYCESCHNGLFTTCDSCETIVQTETCNSVQGSRGRSLSICQTCTDENYFTCSSCNELSHNDHSYSTEHNGTVCEGCYESEYFTCSNCDETLHNDNHGDDGVCTNCARSEDSPIQDYSTRIETKFYGKTASGIRFGVELEVECKKGDKEAHAEKALETMGEFCICKHDGSLHNGFEIVSQPATVEEHKKRWKDFFEINWSERGLRSWDTTTCGMHVHVSRKPLSDLTIAKALVFINGHQNQNFITKIAGRGENSYCKIKQKTYRDVKQRVERYEALNLCNSKTIEFRIFKGSLKKETFFKNLEFCEALIEFCSPAQRSLLDCQSVNVFVTFIVENKKRWPFLHTFIKERLPALIIVDDETFNQNH